MRIFGTQILLLLLKFRKNVYTFGKFDERLYLFPISFKPQKIDDDITRLTVKQIGLPRRTGPCRTGLHVVPD